MRAWPLRRFECCGRGEGCVAARAECTGGGDPKARFKDADAVFSGEGERLLSVGDDARSGQGEVDVVEGGVFAGGWCGAPFAARSAAREAIGDVVPRRPKFFDF